MASAPTQIPQFCKFSHKMDLTEMYRPSLDCGNEAMYNWGGFFQAKRKMQNGMAEKNEIVDVSKCELSDIFIVEEDRKGTDLLAMSEN